MGVKEELLLYLKKQNIGINQLAKELNIEIEKLIDNTYELKAGEFCEICAYLQVDPWDFYKRENRNIRK